MYGGHAVVVHAPPLPLAHEVLRHLYAVCPARQTYPHSVSSTPQCVQHVKPHPFARNGHTDHLPVTLFVGTPLCPYGIA